MRKNASLLFLLFVFHGVRLYSCGTTVHMRDAHIKLDPVPLKVGGMQSAYQEPTGSLRGAILFFPGCGHGWRDAFTKSPACPDCNNCPETTAMARTTLSRGYIVIVFETTNNETLCWDEEQVPLVQASFDFVMGRLGLGNNMPVFGVGSSSGGHFVMQLACTMPLTAISPQVASASPAAIARCIEQRRQLDAQEALHTRHPPALFVTMPKLEGQTNSARLALQALQQHHIHVHELKVYPLQIYPTFFSDRILDMNANVSQAIYQVLKASAFLDANSFLVDPPRTHDELYPTLMKDPVVVAAFSELTWSMTDPWACVLEELSRAYAGHEYCADTMDTVIDFFVAAHAKRTSTAVS